MFRNRSSYLKTQGRPLFTRLIWVFSIDKATGKEEARTNLKKMSPIKPPKRSVRAHHLFRHIFGSTHSRCPLSVMSRFRTKTSAIVSNRGVRTLPSRQSTWAQLEEHQPGLSFPCFTSDDLCSVLSTHSLSLTTE